MAIDGPSNGYKCHLLPLAWDEDLAGCALLAASANHLRFQRPELRAAALKYQSMAIEKLSACTGAVNPSAHVTSVNRVGRDVVLACIVLLLITDIMSGGHQFELLFNMAKSWIEATNRKDSSLPHTSPQHPESIMESFLFDQLDM